MAAEDFASYATDEYIAVKASGDWEVLTPDWQKLAEGSDGVIASGSPWVLNSSSVDFEAAGVKTGHVVRLKNRSYWKGSGDLLAVESADGGSLTMRRIGGNAVGVGHPPVIAGGSSIEFSICTLDPQTAEASRDLNRRFNIDLNVPCRAPSNLYEVTDLRDACILSVLVSRYSAETRAGTGDFALKLAEYKEKLDSVMGSLTVRWTTPAGSTTSSGLVVGRLVRR